MWNRKLFTYLIFSFIAYTAAGQPGKSPELELMHNNARQHVKMGNIDAAITTYKQLLALDAADTRVATELGNVLYIKSDYEQAIAVLAPLTDRTDASDTVYQLLASSQAALHHSKKAHETLNAGITRFPHSGLLFYELGTLHYNEGSELNATKAWQNGIVAAPYFAPNYKSIASSFMTSNQPQWGLICGEQYLLMVHDTIGDELFKKSLYKCWKDFFDKITVLSDGNTTGEMIGIFKQLTPVVSDGISVENLTMVRTRFLMEWMKTVVQVDNQTGRRQDISTHSYTPGLFTDQELLIREGLFDIYNEWLFGRAESKAAFEAWNKFHPDAIDKFEKWRAANPFDPTGLRFIPGEQILETTFSKKKKR